MEADLDLIWSAEHKKISSRVTGNDHSIIYKLNASHQTGSSGAKGLFNLEVPQRNIDLKISSNVQNSQLRVKGLVRTPA